MASSSGKTLNKTWIGEVDGGPTAAKLQTMDGNAAILSRLIMKMAVALLNNRPFRFGGVRAALL